MTKDMCCQSWTILSRVPLVPLIVHNRTDDSLAPPVSPQLCVIISIPQVNHSIREVADTQTYLCLLKE